MTKGIMNHVRVVNIWTKCKAVVIANKATKIIAAGIEGE